MARLLANKRGSSVVEATLAVSTITLLAGLILTTTYIWFTRAWVSYQSEQALYCLGEGRPPRQCRQKLQRHLKTQLPFVDVTVVQAWRTYRMWNVQVQWEWRLKWEQIDKRYVLRLRKELSIQQIDRMRRDLRSRAFL
ncbi:MAG: hypothetical protein KF799_12900 [Bdellovibrionales bacterium]|nr:hypothetical protein [Bdellovibrionales bacterium]